MWNAMPASTDLQSGAFDQVANRLNNGVFDFSVSVLLHPWCFYNNAASLLSCLQILKEQISCKHTTTMPIFLHFNQDDLVNKALF